MPDPTAAGRERHRAAAGRRLAGALLRGSAGFLLVVAALIVMLLPLAIGSELYGENWGASVGCAGSLVLQLALVGVLARFRKVPGRNIVFVICAKGILIMTISAPVGAAIEMIDDRGTATWTGMAIGVGLLALGILAVRLLSRVSTSPRHQGTSSAAVGGALSGRSRTCSGPGFRWKPGPELFPN